MLSLRDRAWWPEALAWLGVPEGFLAELVPAGTPVGRVGDALPAARGAVITVAGHDHVTAMVGAGATADGDVLHSSGTADVFVRSVRQPLEAERIADAVANGVTVGWHVIPERWALLSGNELNVALASVLEMLGVDGQAERDALTRRRGARAGSVAAPGGRRGRADVAARHRARHEPRPRLARRARGGRRPQRRDAGSQRRGGRAADADRRDGRWRARGAAARAVKEEKLGPIEWSPVQEATARGAAVLARRRRGARRAARGGSGGMPMIESPSVVVVGSLNLDLVAEVARLPRRGETLLADGHSRALGGKGANQAVSAARHGVGVAMVGCVGADPDGRRLTDALAAEGIDVSGVRARDDAATGAAHITVDREGANTIVVLPGANAMLSAGDVRDELGRLPAPDVILVQLEIPLDAVDRRRPRAPASRVVLNPAPARPLPTELLRHVDVLVPNVPELGALTGGDVPETLEDVTARARALANGMAVVVTMGEAGALVVDGDERPTSRRREVDAVDTTGAGDAFCGSLAAGLAARFLARRRGERRGARRVSLDDPPGCARGVPDRRRDRATCSASGA